MRTLQIEIRGLKSSGKTTVLHFVGEYLQQQGFNVMAEDDGKTIREFCPLRALLKDDREIRITTHEGPTDIDVQAGSSH